MTTPSAVNPSGASAAISPDYQDLIHPEILGVLAFDLEYRYTLWNPVMERISGYSRSQVLGKCAFDVFPFLKQTGEDRYFSEALQGKSSISKDRPYQTGAGRHGYFEGHYSPVRDEAGKVTGGLAVIFDITERKRMQEALKNAEIILKALFNSRIHNIILIGRDGRIQAFNEGAAQAAREIQGVEYKVGQDFLANIPEAFHGRVLERHARVLAGESLQMETPYTGVDGVVHWYDLQYDPVRGEGGEITGICLTNICIDERKKAEAALRHSEADLRAVFNSGAQAIAFLGTDGKFRTFNRNAVLLAKAILQKEIRVGDFFIDLIKIEELKGFFMNHFNQALSGKSLRVERSHPDPDGILRWFEFTYNPVFDEKGATTGVCMTCQSIDDRKKAEEALKRSEADLRAVFNSGSQVTVLIDRDGRVKGFNHSALVMAPRVLGFSLQVGMSFAKTLPSGASLEMFRKSFEGALEGRETKGERCIRSADGQEHWVEVNYKPVLNDQGGVDGVCFSLSFIDDRKKAEEAMRRSESDLLAVFNSGSQAILLIGKDGRIRAFNKNASQAASLVTRKGLETGQPLADMIPPENIDIFWMDFKRALSGQVIRKEESFKGVDGVTRWVEVNYQPVFIGEGEVDGVCLTVVFIDERKKAETATRESEERYRQLVEFSPETIVVHSEGRILFVNSAGLKMFAIPSMESLSGKTLLDFIHPDYRELSISRVRKIAESGATTEWIEQKLIGMDGRVIEAETKGAPFVFQGRPSVLTIVRDITDRKKNHGMLLRYERLATIGKVIASIAHDIRNPLSVLSNMTQSLKTKLEVDRSHSPEIETILAQTERLKGFMNDILDYSRGLTLHKTNVQIQRLFEEALALTRSQVGPAHKKVRLTWLMEESLPLLWADPERLIQVLTNLLLNAYQAMEYGGELLLSCKAEYEWVSLRIEDTGPGISETDMNHLFEPFFTTKKHGSGLGLSLSQKIVEAHGGRIEVVRLKPHGVAFTLRIPVQRAPLP